MRPIDADTLNFENQTYNKSQMKAILNFMECQQTIDIPDWIPFKSEYDEEEKIEMLIGPIPEADQEILATDGKSVWEDIFLSEGRERYLDSGSEIVSDVIAWMPKPLPYIPDEK